VCALLATKDHLNLFLYDDGGIVPDPNASLPLAMRTRRPE
jgi:hypothetical protein